MELTAEVISSSVEFLGSAIDSILILNRRAVLAFYGGLWYAITSVLTVVLYVFSCFQLIGDIALDVFALLYWCAEKFLVMVSRAALRLDFISQAVPDTLAAVTSSIVKGIIHFVHFLCCLLANVSASIFYPLQLVLSSLEFFGREVREAATECFFGAVLLAQKLGDVLAAVCVWTLSVFSPQNIRNVVTGIPFIFSLDFYLSVVIVILAVASCRRLGRFMRHRNLTCWPLYFTGQLRRIGHFFRRKMKRRSCDGKVEGESDANLLEPIVTASEHSELCIICMERMRDTLLLPCRHLCLCSYCWELLDANFGDRNCPLCRGPVTAYVSDVFFS